MLEQREQRHRRETAERGLRRKPREHAGRRVGQRIAAGIVRLDVPALAARRRRGARARGPASPARRSCRSRTASRSATAMASASSSAFAASITAMAASAASVRANAASTARCAQRSVAAAGRSASETSRSRAARFAERHDLVAARCRCARSSACIASCGWPDGAGAARRRRLVAADQVPGILVEIGVEAGQHHGAVRQLRDGGEQFGGRRHRAGRAGGDHRRSLLRASARARPRSADRAAPPARSLPRSRSIAGQVSRAIFRNPA